MFDLINQKLASSLGTHSAETLQRRLASPGIAASPYTGNTTQKMRNEMFFRILLIGAEDDMVPVDELCKAFISVSN